MNTMNNEQDTVRRGEFVSFQQTVTEGFKRLEDVIADQNRETAKQFGQAFDRISAVQQPDKRSIIAAAGVVLALTVAIGGVLNQRMDNLDTTLQREMRDLNEGQNVAIQHAREEFKTLQQFVITGINRDLDELADRRRRP